MTAHLRTLGLSRRAYARQRGCSESAVRQAIADGRLKPALLRDGSLDPEKADVLMADTTIASKEPPSELSEARLRKLRAQIALLRDEIEAVDSSLAPKAEIQDTMIRASQRVAAKLRGMVDGIVPLVAGVEATMASAVVNDAVYRTLEDLAKTVVVSVGPTAKTLSLKKLDTLTGTELAALKATLQARRMELQSAVRDDELLKLADVGKAMTTRFMHIRTRMLSLHHRSAPRLRHVDAADARAVLVPAIEDMIDLLICEMVPGEKLEARAA